MWRRKTRHVPLQYGRITGGSESHCTLINIAMYLFRDIERMYMQDFHARSRTLVWNIGDRSMLRNLCG